MQKKLPKISNEINKLPVIKENISKNKRQSESVINNYKSRSPERLEINKEKIEFQANFPTNRR